MSSLYNPILLELYLLPVKLNIKMPENSHTSAPSCDPIVTSKLFIYNIYIYIYTLRLFYRELLPLETFFYNNETSNY